jgi:hypothetical protein
MCQSFGGETFCHALDRVLDPGITGVFSSTNVAIGSLFPSPPKAFAQRLMRREEASRAPHSRAPREVAQLTWRASFGLDPNRRLLVGRPSPEEGEDRRIHIIDGTGSTMDAWFSISTSVMRRIDESMSAWVFFLLPVPGPSRECRGETTAPSLAALNGSQPIDTRSFVSRSRRSPRPLPQRREDAECRASQRCRAEVHSRGTATREGGSIVVRSA